MNVNNSESRNFRTELWYAKWVRETTGNGHFDEDGWFVVACLKHERLDVEHVTKAITRIAPKYGVLRFMEVRFVALPNWVDGKRIEGT